MTIDIHKVITGNPITKNLMKPWGSNKEKTIFNKYTGPGNNLLSQVKFNLKTGEIYQILDQPSSSNDRCSMHSDIAYTVAQNTGINDKDVKNKKLQADDKWLKCFKPRSPWDIAAYSAIKSKKVLGLENNFTMNDLSEELNKGVINKFERKKVIINHIDEIHSCDLVDMTKYSKMNKGYKYIFTNIDIFSKIAYAYAIKSKKIQDIKPCFQKIFKERKPSYIWSDLESAFFSKEILKFFEGNNVKIYYTFSNLKSAFVERFNRSLRKLMMKSFVKNDNSVWYNILPNLIKTYNNRYHRSIKMKPIDVNKSNEKNIKDSFYTYDKTNKIPKFEINDLVRISLKRRELFDKPFSNVKWSEELFKIYSTHKSNVITYKIKDLNDEFIQGIFYERELKLSKNTSGEYIIEKILKTKGNQIYVKWRGYSNNFNNWIDKNSVSKYIKTTQFIKIDVTVFSNFKYKNDIIYKFQ